MRLADRLPTAADVDLHLTTLWPPVRLRGWLELRVLDAVPAAWWPALAAIVAGYFVNSIDKPWGAIGFVVVSGIGILTYTLGFEERRRGRR